MLQWLRHRWRPETEDTGTWGEAVAAQWLAQRRGFTILARNWRDPDNRRRELDLVARDGEVLVFVEVKTRRAAARVSGRHAVDLRKKKALRTACDAYLRGLPPSSRPRTFRYDLVEVLDPGAGLRGDCALDESVRHFENVPLFRPFYRR